jgi:hypothetical protein
LRVLARPVLAAAVSLTFACSGGDATPAAGTSADGGSTASPEESALPRAGRNHKGLEPPRADVIPPDLHAGDGTARMAARLAALAQTADPEKNMYLNVPRVAMYEARLAEAKAKGEPLVPVKIVLATERLLAGQADEAVSDFETILGNLKAKGVELNPEFRIQVLNLLAQACMRMGEQSNCVMHHTPDAC